MTNNFGLAIGTLRHVKTEPVPSCSLIKTSRICSPELRKRAILRSDCENVRSALKEIMSQIDLYLVSLSSKTYVFEDKMTKY